jgi:hypothetical protein
MNQEQAVEARIALMSARTALTRAKGEILNNGAGLSVVLADLTTVSRKSQEAMRLTDTEPPEPADLSRLEVRDAVKAVSAELEAAREAVEGAAP